MSRLYFTLRDHNPNGIPYGEAVQLFLWIFSTTSVLPASLRDEPIGKKTLAETFARLSSEGKILPPSTREEGEPGEAHQRLGWDDLVRAFLSDELSLDDQFPNRAGKYFGS